MKFDSKELEEALKETDPEKLHQKATEELEGLGETNTMALLAFAFSWAAFLEARAAYLNTKNVPLATPDLFKISPPLGGF